MAFSLPITFWRRASPEDIRRASEKLTVAIRALISPGRFNGSFAARHVSSIKPELASVLQDASRVLPIALFF